MSRKEDREIVLGNLVSAVHMLQKSRDFVWLIPEIRATLAYAAPGARSPGDVAAVEGRLAAVGGYPRAVGLPAFGASTHMAGTILELRKYDPGISAAICFKCNKEIIEILKEYTSEKGLRFGMIDRNMPPPAGYSAEGGQWRMRYLVDSSGGVPRVFYENEGMGLAQLSIALGREATEVVRMALEVARQYRLKVKN